MGDIARRTLLLAGISAPLAVGALATDPETPATPRVGRGRRPAVPAGIQPMTTVTQSPRGGYFSDPYPIPDPAGGSQPPAFSGSPKSILHADQLVPGAYTPEPITVTVSDGLAQQAAQHGATFQPGTTAPNVWSENNNIARLDDGSWHLATTLRVSNPAQPDTAYWTVVVHASPSGPGGDTIPTAWTADALLVGSYDTPVTANYCGKYVEDGGQLYLTYSKRLNPEPNATNGIVAQPLADPSTLADASPTVLIQPESEGLKSELFFGLTQPPNFRVTETGNVVRIGDIYVMTYSAGAFDRTTYKTGLAYSDSFLPAGGGTYQKVLDVDTTGVWGTPGATEVRYLLQAQEAGWPNYTADQVLAPGVPSIRLVDGDWYLFFAAYQPDDAPTMPDGTFDPSYRRPYFLKLNVDIPAGTTVAGTSSYELAGWITAAGA